MNALEGLRVLVLRPEHQAADLARRLLDEGAQPLVIPAIRIIPPEDWTPVDQVIRTMSGYDWAIFTSVNGVEMVFSRMDSKGFPHEGGAASALPALIGAIGPGTRAALQQRGVGPVWVPGRYTSRALAAQLPDPPARVLLFRASIATTQLEDTLRIRGFDVDRIDAYRTEPQNSARLRTALPDLDAVMLTSASIARCFAQALGSDPVPDGMMIFSIGPATSAECRRAGLQVHVESGEHTVAGLIRTLAETRR